MNTLELSNRPGLAVGLWALFLVLLMVTGRTCSKAVMPNSTPVTSGITPSTNPPPTGGSDIGTLLLSQAPQNVRKMINHLKRVHHLNPPKGFKGGKAFRNRDGKLPKHRKYREYDVHPTVGGQSRGAERLVIDEKKTVFYYTKDHYNTFIKIIQ